MKKKKRFTDTFIYRFIIITIAAVLVVGPMAAILISTNVNEITKYVAFSLVSALYLTALIFSYISYRKKDKE